MSDHDRRTDDGHERPAMTPATRSVPDSQPVVGSDQRSAYTDLGNAERYARQHGDRLRFCKTFGVWYVWNGAFWAKDQRLMPQLLAHVTARNLRGEAAEFAAELNRTHDMGRRDQLESMEKAAWSHARRSQHTARLSAMVSESRPMLSIAWEALDPPSTDLLLNTPSGTVDLQAGRLRPHRRDDMITRCTGVPYLEGATAPRFLAFLERILPYADVRAYVQRWAGYAATGVILEHTLPIWFGTGANGKTTLAELLRAILGDYAIGCPEGFFEHQTHRAHATEIARLHGARLALASETERTANLAEVRVKKLTGGDELTANYMRCDHFTFKPSCKFVLLTNHRPRLRSTDEGLLRRLTLVPFEVTIPPAERDLLLVESLLRYEGPGILAWIVEGARLVLEAGGRLNPPPAVDVATRNYFAEQDVVGRFLDEACTVRPPGDRAVKSKPTDLFNVFRAYCEAVGEPSCGQDDFAKRLRERGYESRSSNGVRWYFGLCPRPQGMEFQ